MNDEFALGLRLKCLELAASAVISGKLHHYDTIPLAREFFDFLIGVEPGCDCEGAEVSDEVMAAAAAKRRH